MVLSNLRPKEVVAKSSERWKGKAKTGEIAEFIVINEHFEPVFNADFPSAVVLQQPPRGGELNP